jgi:hypothetical protein
MTKPFQILASIEADFEKMTWTFALNSDTRVAGGCYAILYSETYMKMSEQLARAEGLLRRYIAGERDGQFHEHVLRHFDPDPL